MTKSQWALLGQKHVVDGLENDLLHRWEVEVLHCQLSTVLNVNSQMNFFLVIVLDAKDEAKIKPIHIAILLHNMDQVVEHAWVEQLDVFDNEDNRLGGGQSSCFDNLLDTQKSASTLFNTQKSGGHYYGLFSNLFITH